MSIKNDESKLIPCSIYISQQNVELSNPSSIIQEPIPLMLKVSILIVGKYFVKI